MQKAQGIDIPSKWFIFHTLITSIKSVSKLFQNFKNKFFETVLKVVKDILILLNFNQY